MAMMLNHRGMRSGALAIALLAGSSLSALAATYTLTFGAGSETGVNTSSNARGYSVAGIPAMTVTVTGWSTTGAGGQLDRAWLGSYSSGLGVCTTADGGVGCNQPQHQVDGAGSQDFILIEFSLPVDPLSIVIDPSTSDPNYKADTDVRYYINSAAKTLATIDTMTPSQVGTAGAVNGAFVTGPVTVDLVAPNTTVQVLVGVPNTASLNTYNQCLTTTTTTTADCVADLWKLTSVKFDYVPSTPPGGAGNPVPAPGALALFGVALAGLAVTRRRRG